MTDEQVKELIEVLKGIREELIRIGEILQDTASIRKDKKIWK